VEQTAGGWRSSTPRTLQWPALQHMWLTEGGAQGVMQGLLRVQAAVQVQAHACALGSTATLGGMSVLAQLPQPVQLRPNFIGASLILVVLCLEHTVRCGGVRSESSVVTHTPLAVDPGCVYTRLYVMSDNGSCKQLGTLCKRRRALWQPGCAV
jgi:hypothetical protein